MRPFLPSFKTLFVGFGLALAATGAQAQTVSITATSVPGGFGGTVLEGGTIAAPTGSTAYTFTMTKTGTGTNPLLGTTVTLDFSGSTALNPEDYTVVCQCTFTAAQATRTITITVKRDSKFELANELISVALATADNGFTHDPTARTFTVQDDDTPPTISIGDRTVTEGSLANFAVTLSNGSYLPVSVTATTADNTANGVATPPFPLADYTTNAPGTVVTFAPHATVLTQNVGIPTINDVVYEGVSPETYFVNLTNALLDGVTPLTVTDAQGNGFITDNEALPTVSITSAATVSENAGTYPFTVTLNRQSVDTITVTATAVPGTAQQVAAPFPVADFDPINPLTQPLIFAAGETSKIVNVTINDDLIDEANETFAVQLGALGNVNPGTLNRTGTIVDNDALPVLSIVATSSPVLEGAGTATFTVSLTPVSGRPVSATVQTLLTGTAISGVDYTATGPTVFSWTPGDNTAQTLVVPITDDLLDEANETFRGNISGLVNAAASPSNADMTIVDNDAQPVISISDGSITELNSPNTANMTFVVSLSGPSGQTVTVRASTANGTATAGSDYVAKSLETVTFPPGTTGPQFFSVVTNGDNFAEYDETFLVNLSAPTGASVIGDGQGVGTIFNDDVGVQIDDASIAEDDLGANLVFTVSRNAAGPAVTFDYITTPAGAVAGASCGGSTDYVSASGSGFIPANTGSSFTTITVPICSDLTPEAYDKFNVVLQNVVGVTVLDGTAVGTINNDDAVQAGALKISEFRLSGPGGANDEFIEIANVSSTSVTVFTTDPSGGFSVARSGGTFVFMIPNGTTIPARGHLLAVNNVGYSLSAYGGLNTANPNRTWSTPIPDDTGLALFPTSDPLAYPTSTPLDAVGFTGDATPTPTQYVEGPTGLTGIGSGPFVHNYSFVRRHTYGPGAALQDTNDSAADFALVAVDGGTYGTVTSLLGGPSPENLSAETERSNGEVAIGGGTNAFTGVVVGPGQSPKALEFRRTFTNMTASSLTALRFKITSLTGVNSLGGVADLRPTTSGPVGPYLGLTLEAMPSADYVLTTPAVPVGPYPPGTLPNGGLNSTWRVATPSIAPLGTVDVNFRVEYTLSGLPYFIWVVPEAK